MKILLLLLFLLLSAQIQAQSDFSNRFLDSEESIFNSNQNKALDKTRDALMKYDIVEKRANYFLLKIKNLTFGEYSEDVMVIAPFVTGKFEFRLFKFDVYYDHFNNNKSGVKYSLKF